MVSKEQLLVWSLREPAVLRLAQLPPKWSRPALVPPPFSAAERDWSFPPSTSLMGDSASSQAPCLSSDRRRHSVERNDALAGGGADGRSAFLRLPRWCVVTYPQNTESGSRDKKKYAKVCRQHQCKQAVKRRDRVYSTQSDITHTHTQATRISISTYNVIKKTVSRQGTVRGRSIQPLSGKRVKTIKQQPKKTGNYLKEFSQQPRLSKHLWVSLPFNLNFGLWAAQYLPRMLIKSSYRSYVSNGCWRL